MRTPALIFDFGNVVAFFDYGIACRAIAEPRGLVGPDLLAKARQAGLNDLVTRYERGAIPSASFAEECCRLFGLEVEPREFAAAWADIFRPNESIVPLIRTLHASGHRLVVAREPGGVTGRPDPGSGSGAVTDRCVRLHPRGVTAARLPDADPGRIPP